MKKNLFNTLLMMVMAAAAQAQWSGDPAVGTSVTSASSGTAKTGDVAVTDGAGGMFVAWIDSRLSSSQSIFVQRTLASGTKKFGSDIEITSATNLAGTGSLTKSNLYMISDGVGGAILVWQDARYTTSTNTNNDIYGQRIDAAGNPLWAAGGVRLTVSDNAVSNKIVPIATLLNSTEMLVVFGDNRLGTLDLFSQKILISNGTTEFTVSGTSTDIGLHGNQANTQTAASADIVPDGSGGACIVWSDPRLATTNTDIYAQRINNSGMLLWGASGTVVCNVAASNQNAPRAVSDGTGGVVTTWLDLRISAADVNVYAQRLDNTGAAQWTTNGVAVCTATGNQNNPLIVNAGTNYIISWADNRVSVSDRNIYAQSVDGSGNMNWTTDGVAITTATGNQPVTISGPATTQYMISDGANGAIIYWDDARISTSNTDIYAQRINSSGMVLWTPNGVPVSTASGNQSAPVAVPGAIAGTSLVAWRDSRTAANGEIYAARLQVNGVLPVRSLNVSAVAKTTAVAVKWTTVDESNTASFVVEKSADGTSFLSIGSLQAKGLGNGTYVLEDNYPTKGTGYYRIKTFDQNGSFAYSSIATVDFSGSVKPSLAVYPNPVQQAAMLHFSNFAKGTYVLMIRDLGGRLVLQKTVFVNTDYQQIEMPLLQSAAGSYLLQVTGNNQLVFAGFFVKK